MASPPRGWLAAGLVAVVLAACSQEHSENGAKGDDDDPAKVVKVEGTDVKSVILTARAADRLGIKTEPVREPSTPGSTPIKAVPLAALFYDKSGDVWVYTTTAPRTYLRQRVKVARIEGDMAILESGPGAGTAVVSVGAAELAGSEFGVGGAQ